MNNKERVRKLLEDAIDWGAVVHPKGNIDWFKAKADYINSQLAAIDEPVVEDEFIKKHMNIIMGKMADANIESIIERMWGGLEMASVEHFVQTGKVNGNFHLRLKELMYHFAARWHNRVPAIDDIADGKGDVDWIKNAKEMQPIPSTAGVIKWPEAWIEIIKGDYPGETCSLSEYEWKLEQIVDYIKEEPTLIGLCLLAKVFPHPPDDQSPAAIDKE